MENILYKILVIILLVEILFVVMGLSLIRFTPDDPKPIYEYYDYVLEEV